MALGASGEARIWLVGGLVAAGLATGVPAGELAAAPAPPVSSVLVDVTSEPVSIERAPMEVDIQAEAWSGVAGGVSPIGRALADFYGSMPDYLGVTSDGQMHFHLFGSQAQIAKVGLSGPLTMAGVYDLEEEFSPGSISAGGDVYNTISIYNDEGGCQLKKWSLSTNSVTAISAPHTTPRCGMWPFSPTDGPIATKQLPAIGNIVFDSTGRAFFAEYTNGKIRMYDPASGLLSTVAGSLTSGDSGDGGPATSALVSVRDKKLEMDGSNRILFVQNDTGSVRRIDLATGLISTVYTPPTGFEVVDFAVAPDGTLYVVNTDVPYQLPDRIVRVNTDGSTSFIGTGTAGYQGDGGAASTARLYQPTLVDVLPDNSLIFRQQIGTFRTGIYDPLGPRLELLRRVTSAGVISTISGLGDVNVDPYALVFGIRRTMLGLVGDNALVVEPTITLDPGASETLIKSAWRPEQDGDITWARTPSGGVELYGSYGTGAGYVHARRSISLTGVVTDSVNSAVPIDPALIGYDSAGNAYYVPKGECRIVKRAPSGTETTFYGAQACGNPSNPISRYGYMSVRHDGVVYYSPGSGTEIHRIGTNGVAQTIAAAPDSCSLFDEGRPVHRGPANQVCFSVGSMTVDRGGNVFIADFDGGKILKLSHDGQFSPVVEEDVYPSYWIQDMVIAPNGTLYFGGYSSIAKIANLAATVPSAPATISASAGDGSVVVRWSPPADGGSAITGYTVTGGGGCTTTTNSCTITGLTNNTNYSFTVTASNLVGTSAASSSVTARPLATPNPTVLNALPATLSVPDTTPDVGVPFVLSVSGFQPFEWVVISLQSAPQVLNSVQANAQGAISVPVVIPSGTASGSHTLSALGTTSGIGFRAPVSVGAIFGLVALDSPKRLVDTRASGGRFGSSSASGVSVRRVQVAGASTYLGAASGLPSSGVGAVAMNVTVVDGRDKDGYGFVTVYPCASTSTPVPDASNLNFAGGQTVPNSVLAPLSSDGYVCFSVYGDAHLLVDVSGWMAPAV